MKAGTGSRSGYVEASFQQPDAFAHACNSNSRELRTGRHPFSPISNLQDDVFSLSLQENGRCLAL